MQSERQAQTRAEVANHGDGDGAEAAGREAAGTRRLLALLLLVPIVDDHPEAEVA